MDHRAKELFEVIGPTLRKLEVHWAPRMTKYFPLLTRLEYLVILGMERTNPERRNPLFCLPSSLQHLEIPNDDDLFRILRVWKKCFDFVPASLKHMTIRKIVKGEETLNNLPPLEKLSTQYFPALASIFSRSVRPDKIKIGTFEVRFSAGKRTEKKILPLRVACANAGMKLLDVDYPWPEEVRIALLCERAGLTSFYRRIGWRTRTTFTLPRRIRKKKRTTTTTMLPSLRRACSNIAGETPSSRSTRREHDPEEHRMIIRLSDTNYYIAICFAVARKRSERSLRK